MKRYSAIIFIILIVLLSSVLIGCNKTPEIFDPKTYVGTYEKAWIQRIIIHDYIEDGLDYMINEEYILDGDPAEWCVISRTKDIVNVARQETSDDLLIDEIVRSADSLGKSLKLTESEAKFDNKNYTIQNTSPSMETLKYGLEENENLSCYMYVSKGHIFKQMLSAMVYIDGKVTAADGKEYEYQVTVWYIGESPEDPCPEVIVKS